MGHTSIEQRLGPPESSDPNYGDFFGATDRIPRPKADAPAYQFQSPESVARLQKQWDAAAKRKAELDTWVADRQKERDAIQHAESAALQKRQDERIAGLREKTLSMLKQGYMAVPGMTEKDWDAEKETVLRDYAKAQAISGNAAGERGVHSLINSTF